MGKLTVTAAEGVRAKVTIQKLEEHKREIQALKDGAGNVIAPAETQVFKGWADVAIDTFASEARDFDIGPGTRLIVEEQQ